MAENWPILCLVATLMTGSSGVSFADSPSFNCALAQTADEFVICRDSELSALDVSGSVGFEYVARTHGRARAKEVGRSFLTARHACGDDSSCIKAVQIAAIGTWRSLGAPIGPPDATDTQDAPLPQTIGACAQTHILGIEGRLSGDTSFESGTVVLFTNESHQVSYDREPKIIGSRIGDPVTICLAHIPSSCPSGDDRGRVYRTTNQRTGDSWSLPDAEHECGGA